MHPQPQIDTDLPAAPEHPEPVVLAIRPVTCSQCQYYRTQNERLRRQLDEVLTRRLKRLARERQQRSSQPEPDAWMQCLRRMDIWLRDRLAEMTAEEIALGIDRCLKEDHAAVLMSAELWSAHQQAFAGITESAHQQVLATIARMIDHRFPGNTISRDLLADDPESILPE